jgi:hypothetical protein
MWRRVGYSGRKNINVQEKQSVAIFKAEDFFYPEDSKSGSKSIYCPLLKRTALPLSSLVAAVSYLETDLDEKMCQSSQKNTSSYHGINYFPLVATC